VSGTVARTVLPRTAVLSMRDVDIEADGVLGQTSVAKLKAFQAAQESL